MARGAYRCVALDREFVRTLGWEARGLLSDQKREEPVFVVQQNCNAPAHTNTTSTVSCIRSPLSLLRSQPITYDLQTKFPFLLFSLPHEPLESSRQFPRLEIVPTCPET